jgi:hypothetical protein
MREIHSGKLCIPRIADRFDLPERIKPMSPGNLFDSERLCLGGLFGNWLRFLGAGCGSKDEGEKNQETDRI